MLSYSWDFVLLNNDGKEVSFPIEDYSETFLNGKAIVVSNLKVVMKAVPGYDFFKLKCNVNLKDKNKFELSVE